MLIYDTSEWKEKTSFSTGEGTVPCKICYLAVRKGKETTWFLFVSCADLSCEAVFCVQNLFKAWVCIMKLEPCS